MARKIEQYSAKEVLCRQFLNNIFCREDLFINYMALEDYYGKIDYGWHIYLKKQYVSHHRRSHPWKERFTNLIKSIEDNGYQADKYPLKLNEENGLILDGCHRFACVLYFNVKDIYCYGVPISYYRADPKFTRKRIGEKCYFTGDELDLIVAKKIEIFEKLDMSKDYFKKDFIKEMKKRKKDILKKGIDFGNKYYE